MALESSSFQISGLVSGLSTNDIISELMEIEKTPVTLMEAEQTDLTNRLTAWRDFNTRMQAMKVQSSYVSDTDTFETTSVNSSNSEVLTVSSTSGVSQGTYYVTVKALAQNHQTVSQAYDSSDAEVGTGTINIQIGSATYEPIEITEDNNTLEGIRDAINQANYGITASLVEVGGETTQYKLMLVSETDGKNGEMTIDMDLTGGTLPEFTTIQEAQDAHITLGSGENALDVYRSSNTINDVIDGVTLNLLDVDTENPVVVTVSQNVSSVRSTINDFIDQFNAIVDYFDDQFYYDSTTKTTGTLFNDTNLLLVKQQLYDKITGLVSNDSEYRSLSEIGIGLDDSGKLYIEDSSLFTDATANNMEEVSKLFTDGEDGIGVRLDSYIDSIMDSTTGIISTTEEFLTEEIDDLEDSIADKEEYLERVEARYYEEFTAMETALATLKSEGEYLDYQIASLLDSSDS